MDDHGDDGNRPGMLSEGVKRIRRHKSWPAVMIENAFHQHDTATSSERIAAGGCCVVQRFAATRWGS
jgi:hypothetical protein